MHEASPACLHVDQAVEHVAQRAYLNTPGRQAGGPAAHEDGQPIARSKRSLHIPFDLIADHRCLVGFAAQHLRRPTIGIACWLADTDLL